MKDNKILIVGFSGAGKTYLLEELKQRGEAGDDLDQILTSQMKINNSREMINLIGLVKFRELEFKALKDWVRDSNTKYLALGGGSIHQESIEYINQSSDLKVLFINKSFEDCWAGLQQRGHSHLIDLGVEKSQQLYQQRLGFYKQLNNMTEYKDSDDYIKCLY